METPQISLIIMTDTTLWQLQSLA